MTPAPVAAAAGRLFGVGVGPGDPDLVTVKAARVIAAADVIAYPIAPRAGATGVARAIAGPHMRAGVREIALTYPITIEPSDHPGGYEAAIVEFYDASAAELATHLDAGRDAGPFANASHYFILVGLFGAFFAGLLAIFLPTERPGPTAVRLPGGIQAPLGGVLILVCAAFALSGFPLDDMWHRIFGQDVTLWVRPTCCSSAARRCRRSAG